LASTIPRGSRKTRVHADRKKINLSLAGKGGFKVFPPTQYLERPEVLNDADMYEQLKDTV
jgi:hypothetical protein